jgi:hypothetical protein
MKYEIIDTVSRFVTRFGMLMDPETMNKARDEAEEYDFREISEGHYAVIHGKKMYVIIERDGEIGCSYDGEPPCKYVIAFIRLMAPVTKKIDEADATHLRHVCGWTGEELHPEIELGGPGAVVQEDTKPTPKERIPPDPDLDIGVNDRLPEPKKPPLPTEYTRICKYCGMGATRKDEAVADAWKEVHEAQCPKNPANDPKKLNDALIESEQEPEEGTKMDETTTNTQTAVQTTEPQRGFLTAAVSLDDAIKAFDLYGQAKTRLLNDNDVLYIGASGKPVHKDVKDSVPYIKKSGWRKMARFFGLSVDILGKEKIWTEDAKGDKYYIWAYQIKVSHQCGAYVLAEGVCSSRDKFFTKGGKVPADETNVMLKAQTVGINRGISDLLGAGEVSAEEVE